MLFRHLLDAPASKSSFNSADIVAPRQHYCDASNPDNRCLQLIQELD
jgi:hypothetical protein